MLKKNEYKNKTIKINLMGALKKFALRVLLFDANRKEKFKKI